MNNVNYSSSYSATCQGVGYNVQQVNNERPVIEADELKAVEMSKRKDLSDIVLARRPSQSISNTKQQIFLLVFLIFID